MTTNLSIKFKGLEDRILNEIVDLGLFSTKSEAVRAALVKYAMDMNLFNRKSLWEEIEKAPRRNISAKKLMAELEKLESTTE